ncbi:MAG: hypothetical protein IT460_12220 [Planctomycetes bacterium]|nr:hypothetical protein [Planctomycetota bacterium]
MRAQVVTLGLRGSLGLAILVAAICGVAAPPSSVRRALAAPTGAWEITVVDGVTGQALADAEAYPVGADLAALLGREATRFRFTEEILRRQATRADLRGRVRLDPSTDTLAWAVSAPNYSWGLVSANPPHPLRVELERSAAGLELQLHASFAARRVWGERVQREPLVVDLGSADAPRTWRLRGMKPGAWRFGVGASPEASETRVARELLPGVLTHLDLPYPARRDVEILGVVDSTRWGGRLHQLRFHGRDERGSAETADAEILGAVRGISRFRVTLPRLGMYVVTATGNTDAQDWAKVVTMTGPSEAISLVVPELARVRVRWSRGSDSGDRFAGTKVYWSTYPVGDGAGQLMASRGLHPFDDVRPTEASTWCAAGQIVIEVQHTEWGAKEEVVELRAGDTVDVVVRFDPS